MTDGDVHSNEMPHDPLDAFFDDLRAAAAETPTPAVGDALATLFRDGAAPVTSVIGSRRWRWSMRATVAGAVAGVAFGGLGVAGALPRPVQHGVAGVVRHVGVELPDPATTTTTEPTVPTTRPAFVPTPSTNDDDHGPGTAAAARAPAARTKDLAGRVTPATTAPATARRRPPRSPAAATTTATKAVATSGVTP
jgi:hypothetical protein